MMFIQVHCSREQYTEFMVLMSEREMPECTSRFANGEVDMVLPHNEFTASNLEKVGASWKLSANRRVGG